MLQNPTRQVHQRMTRASYFTKETGTRSMTANGSILQVADKKPYISIGESIIGSRGAPWFPITLIHQLVAPGATPIRKLEYLK